MLTRSRKALTVFSLAARMHADNFKIGGRRISAVPSPIFGCFLTIYILDWFPHCYVSKTLRWATCNSYPSPNAVPKSLQASHTFMTKPVELYSPLWFLKFKLPLTISRSIMYLFHCKYFEMWKSRNLILGFFVKQFFPKTGQDVPLLKSSQI